MYRLMKILPLALALATLSIFAGCGSGNSAHVRMVNAIPDISGSQPLDVYFNGTRYFPSVAFGSVVPGGDPATYTSVPSGSDTVQAYVAGSTSSPLFGGTGVSGSFGSSTEYTGVLSGFNSNPSFFYLTDTLTAPVTGNVEFRTIHASSSVQGAVDVYYLGLPNMSVLGVTPDVTGLAYQQATSYVSKTYNSNGFYMVVTFTGTKIPISGFGFTITPPNNSIRTTVLKDVSGGGQMSPSPLVLDDLGQ
jgi:hypothetical protein